MVILFADEHSRLSYYGQCGIEASWIMQCCHWNKVISYILLEVIISTYFLFSPFSERFVLIAFIQLLLYISHGQQHLHVNWSCNRSVILKVTTIHTYTLCTSLATYCHMFPSYTHMTCREYIKWWCPLVPPGAPLAATYVLQELMNVFEIAIPTYQGNYHILIF